MTKDEQIKQILNDFRPERADEFVELIKEVFRKKPRTDQDIVDAIELFRKINSTIDNCFKNKNQRLSITRLLNSKGKARIEKAIVYINGHRKELYFPLIKDPCSLEAKWVDLENFARKDKVKKKEGKTDQPNDLDYLKEETRKFNARRDEALKNKLK
jgi:hypothetical protein